MRREGTGPGERVDGAEAEGQSLRPPISLAPAFRTGSKPPLSSKNIHKVSPLAAGEPGQGADANDSALGSASEPWPSSWPGARGAKLRQQFLGLGG